MLSLYRPNASCVMERVSMHVREGEREMEGVMEEQGWGHVDDP